MGSGDLDRAKIKARALFAFGVRIAHGFVDATLRDGWLTQQRPISAGER
jgi:hypothetical protein